MALREPARSCAASSRDRGFIFFKNKKPGLFRKVKIPGVIKIYIEKIYARIANFAPQGNSCQEAAFCKNFFP